MRWRQAWDGCRTSWCRCSAPGLVRDFTADALFSGIGAFLVFVPQIFVLTFVIGLLEDSGYMARAALICHRPLRFFGLTGKSFIPMLSGVWPARSRASTPRAPSIRRGAAS
jgi:Fe2+ transport system protein B